MQHLLRILAWVILAPAIVSPAQASEAPLRLRIHYLAYPVDWNGKLIVIGGRFQTPLNVAGKIPAVIILHDTAGVKNNGTYYATALNQAGIATFEIDQWGGRGLPGGASSRPQHPGDNLPDVGGAYRLLIARPEIDAARIGLLGFSMGGIETMLMMTRRNSDAILGPGHHCKAAVAMSPFAGATITCPRRISLHSLTRKSVFSLAARMTTMMGLAHVKISSINLRQAMLDTCR